MAQANSDNTFDIIIIGGGAAGCLLAARLSSNSSLNVLVLEAGQNRNDDANVRIPGLSKKLLGNPLYDWQFETQPEDDLNGRVIQQPRGKFWGGSSAINSHALVYPSREYHDAWDTLLEQGDKEARRRWDWENMKKYYQRFQTVRKPSEDIRHNLGIGEVGQHEVETSGSIQASFPVTEHLLQKAWADVIHDLGYSYLKEPADGEIGGTTTTNAIDSLKGERSHAGIAFLDFAAQRKNLIVRSSVLVEKVLFGKNKVDGRLIAEGALYSLGEGGEETAHARREVVICAGTFGSPKILELSGIGGREVLTSADIECLRDLPGVGENLQDHLNFGPSVEVNNRIETADVPARDSAVAEAAKQLYEAQHRGPLAEGSAYSFTHIPLAMTESEGEQRELNDLVKKVFHEMSPTMSEGPKAQFAIIQDMIRDPNEATATVFMTRKQRYTPPSEPAPGNYMTILAMYSYPFSRGSSHIQSTDTRVPPEITFKYLQHPLDAEVFARHIVQIGLMLELPKLSEYLKPNGNTLPSGFPRRPKNLEKIKEHLRQSAATNYHPAGTCAMMREELDGVVDECLKVYGTANLRVCDASVIPIVPRGNILSTVYAIAEKAADILKEVM